VKPAPCTRYEVRNLPHITCSVLVEELREGVPGVYEILDIDSEKVVYVGQSRCLKSRFLHHEHAAHKDVYFRVVTTEECSTLFDRLEIEAETIRTHLCSGNRLDLNNDSATVKYRKTLGYA